MKSIVKELDIKADSILSKFANMIGLSKTNKVKQGVSTLYKKIENNEHLKSIELPVINEYVNSISGTDESESSSSKQQSGGVNAGLDSKWPNVGAKGASSKSTSDKSKQIESWERKFSGVLLKVFQILEDYMELLFKASMNVPRIIGYILFYCHQTHISIGRKITKAAIDSAAQKYYEKVIYSFFEVPSHSLLSFDEKVSELQQRELLSIFVGRLK